MFESGAEPDRPEGSDRGDALDGAVGAEHPVSAAVADVQDAAAKLLTCATGTLSDADARDALAGAAVARASVEAAYLRLVRELDVRPVAVPGAVAGRVARTFLIHALHVDAADAGRDAAAAHAIDPDTESLPRLGWALADGEVSRAHVDVAVRALRRVPTRLLTRHFPDTSPSDQTGDQAGDQSDPENGDLTDPEQSIGARVGQEATGADRVDAFLTGAARGLSPGDTSRVAAQMLAVVDPDSADGFDPDAVLRRGLRMATDATGMLILRGELDPAAAAVVRAAFDHYAAPEAAGTAVSEDGEDGDPVRVPDRRTPAQRHADALTAICRVALDHRDHHGQSDQRPDRARILITATPDQVRAAALRAAETDSATAGPRVAGSAVDEQTGQPVSPRLLGRWLCEATLHRVLLDAAGAVLDHGRAVRTATAAQRRALTARDGGCVIPGCHAPASWCDAHHATPWAASGGTDIDNLALLCPRHHGDVHAGIWTVTNRGGIPWVRPPRWVDPHQRLLRNTTRRRDHQARHLGQQLLRDQANSGQPPERPPERPSDDG